MRAFDVGIELFDQLQALGIERRGKNDLDFSEQIACLANGIGFAHVIEMRRAFVEIVGLGLPAADPADALECSERRSRSGRIRRFAVVDEDDAVPLADALHAMWQAGVCAEAILDLCLVHFQGAAASNGGQRVLKIVWSLKRGPDCLSFAHYAGQDIPSGFKCCLKVLGSDGWRQRK